MEQSHAIAACFPTLERASSQVVTVDYRTSDGTALVSNKDYVRNFEYFLEKRFIIFRVKKFWNAMKAIVTNGRINYGIIN